MQDNTSQSEWDDSDLVAPKGRKLVAALALVVLLTVVGLVAVEGFRRFKVKQEDAHYTLYETGEYMFAGADIAALHDTHIPGYFVDGAPDAVPHQIAGIEDLGDIFVELMATRYMANEVERRILQDQLIDTWNVTLADEGIPFRIALPARERDRGERLFVLSYYVVARTEMTHGEQRVPVYLSTRADDLNIIEGYAGSSDRVLEEVQVVVDSVAKLAADAIWPMLDASDDDDRQPLEAQFAPLVRQEVEAFVARSDLRSLERTASGRREVVQIVELVHGRRRCGSTLLVPMIPLRGLEIELLDELEEGLESSNSQCVPVEMSELDSLRDFRRTMMRTPGTREGVHALTAFMARNVAVGQIRAAAVEDPEAVCTNCRGLGRLSTSAALSYIAQIAHGPAPYTSLYRVCSMRDADHNVSRRAALFIESRLLEDGCEGPLPDDLSSAARSLEEQMAPGLPAIGAPDGFPSHLPSRFY